MPDLMLDSGGTETSRAHRASVLMLLRAPPLEAPKEPSLRTTDLI